jgi:hypothetical protein
MKEIWAERQGLAAFVPKAEKVYVDELLDELEKYYRLEGCRGLPQFRSHLKSIRTAFGDMRAADVTPKIVDDYIDDCLAGDKKAGTRPKAPTTINRETQLLGQAFKLGIERRHLNCCRAAYSASARDDRQAGIFRTCHPEGKRFVVLKPPKSRTDTKFDKVTFIFNFFDELRRLAPTPK